MAPHFIQLARQAREIQKHLHLLEESRRELIEAYRNTIEVSRELRAQLQEANAILAELDGDSRAG
ncbi:MAG TPA: hypothetical protein VMV10_02135 [Pirellulales bacterium]|nr:hypothetical protein [Pirellulales bacterium]